jgi:hypothetical protein
MMRRKYMPSSYALIIAATELSSLNLLDVRRIENRKNALHQLFRIYFSHAHSLYRRTMLLPAISQRNRLITTQMEGIHQYNLERLSNIKIVLYKAKLEEEEEIAGRNAEAMRFLDTLEQRYEVNHDMVDKVVKEEKNLTISVGKLMKRFASEEKDMIRTHGEKILNELDLTAARALNELVRFTIHRLPIPKKFSDIKLAIHNEISTALTRLLLLQTQNHDDIAALSKAINTKLKTVKTDLQAAQEALTQLRDSRHGDIQTKQQNLQELHEKMKETILVNASLKYRIEHELVPKLTTAMQDKLTHTSAPQNTPTLGAG